LELPFKLFPRKVLSIIAAARVPFFTQTDPLWELVIMVKNAQHEVSSNQHAIHYEWWSGTGLENLWGGRGVF